MNREYFSKKGEDNAYVNGDESRIKVHCIVENIHLHTRRSLPKLIA